MSRISEISLNKVPEVTPALWIIKIAAITMDDVAVRFSNFDDFCIELHHAI